MPDQTLEILMRIRADVRELKGVQQSARKLNREITGLNQSFSAGIGLTKYGIGLGTAAFALGKAVKEGVRFNALIEQQTVAFRTLLGSMEEAEKRIDSLVDFAAFTPFELPEIVQANKVLEVLSDGMLSTERGMRLVGDAAASVGRGFRETAFWVGRLAAGLESGTAVGEATLRLIELGLISGKTAKEMQFLAKEAHNTEEVWRILERVFGDATGAMELQSRTFNGLAATMRDTLRVLAAEKFESVFETMKNVMEEFLEAVDALPDATERAVEEIEAKVGRLRDSILTADDTTLDSVTAEADKFAQDTDQTLSEIEARIDFLTQLEESLVNRPSFQDAQGGVFDTSRVERLSQTREELKILEARKEALDIGRREIQQARDLAAQPGGQLRAEIQGKINALKREEQKRVADNIKLHDEALKKEDLTRKQLEAKQDQLLKLQQTDEQRLAFLDMELSKLRASDAEMEERARLFRDQAKGEKVLEVFRLENEKEITEILIEQHKIREKLAKANTKEKEEFVQLQSDVLERQLDQIEHQKELIKLEGESASSRKRIRELVGLEKQLLGELVQLWAQYGEEISDPKVLESVRAQIQSFQQRSELAGFSSETPIRFEQSIDNFEALRDPAIHFQDAYSAATAALLDYQAQVGTVSDQIFDNLIQVQEAFSGGIADSIEGLITRTMTWGDALENVGLTIGRSIVRSFAEMLANWITTQITMLTLGRAFGATATATAGAQAASLAAAWSPAAIAASIATLGSASAEGLAAYIAAQTAGTTAATVTSVAQGATSGGSFAEGGFTGPGPKDQIAGIVHAGEFVVPADVVSRTGPQFFEGVTKDIRRGGKTSSVGSSTMIVVDSRKSAERYLESAEGEARIVDIMELNKGRLI